MEAEPHSEKPPASSAQRFVLHHVRWEDYEKILEAVAEQYVRVTFDQGSLELASWPPLHGCCKRYLGLLLTLLAVEWDFPLKSMGSSTLRLRGANCGADPDACFYLASAKRLKDWRMLDLAVEPPPDLVVEVEDADSALNRLGVFAALGVPEVWGYDGRGVKVYHRHADGRYRPRSKSLAFPALPMADVAAFIQQGLGSRDDRVWTRRAMNWARELASARSQRKAARRAGKVG